MSPGRDGPDFDHPTEKCGVVGVSLDGRDAAFPTYYALYALQHRGQESAGIVTHDGFQ
ncbi:MAG: amidophosphoribosyltransferase, partial [Halobacterium sp.]